ncbi:hypothetical protein RB653_005758 [Dictyostelium firmibasis]|uniref:J domain-containing protein n=1 Tax=Dictyostelium firmibasis TaxID=79012 RepID=A0AAN7YZJ7_9MYCE
MKILNNNILKYKEQRNKIIKVAIICKLIIWIYCLIVSQQLENFDSSTTINVLSPLEKPINSSLSLNNDIESINKLKDHSNTSPIINFLIKRIFVKWDSIYFIRIAEFGYEHEQNHAFFPLFPLLMNIFAKALNSFSFIHSLSFSDCIIVSGFIISNLSFVLSAVQLLKLGYIIFNNSEFAFTATLLYCINPAGIFTTAVYTENLFNLMIFSGLVQVFGGDYYLLEMNGRELGTHTMPLSRKIWCTTLASLFFSMATATRSNGILMCGFIIYTYYSSYITHVARLILRCLHSTKNYKKTYLLKPSNSMDKLPLVNSGFDSSSLTKDLFLYPLLIIIQSLIIILPYIAFQYYGYSRFCTNNNLNNFQVTGSSIKNGDWPRSWCQLNGSGGLFKYPNLYGFVQNHYWNQGFFNYYTVSQIPNFLFATPMVLLSIGSIVSYLKYFINQPNQMIYSTFKSRSKNITNDTTSQLASIGHSSNTFSLVYFSPHLLPFIVYLSFLTVFSVTFMHVQVITRFFIHSPLIFWFSAKFFMNRIPEISTSSPRMSDSATNSSNNNNNTNASPKKDESSKLIIVDSYKKERVERILILSYFIFYNILVNPIKFRNIYFALPTNIYINKSIIFNKPQEFLSPQQPINRFYSTTGTQGGCNSSCSSSANCSNANNNNNNNNHESELLKKIKASPCWSCNEHIEKKKIFCPMCNKVQKMDDSIDIFFLFDIKPSFRVDLKDLSHRFKKLQKQLHPDLFEQSDSQHEKNISKEISTSLNTAYNILKSPFLRAEYILNQKGLDLSSVGDVDPDVLMEVLEVREAIDEGTEEEIKKIAHENREKINDVIENLENEFQNKNYQEALKQTVYLRYLTRIQEEVHNRLDTHI